jgi:tRNA nucleotidyltransferase (CCA-adding enzyme)
MARRARSYPQVEPGASALVDARVAPLPARARVAAALGLARKRDLAALATVEHRVVLREDLARAVELALGDLPAASLARSVPVVDGRASEVTVRRHLVSGAPLVLIADRVALGAVTPGSVPWTGAPSLAARIRRELPVEVVGLLEVIGRIAGSRGARAYLVAGVVRDLLLGRPDERVDIDIVVEGDAPSMADALAKEIGGAAIVHPRFLTASVETPHLGRIDLITARSERYETRGALPRVMPAGIRQDLKRRDFTINALAIDLGSAALPLLDPFGGRLGLTRRRLAVLHPLSFVEDPTRLFRGARYAARLGFGFDASTARAARLGLRLGPYPALSGQRLTAEVERIVADANPGAALGRLGRIGAFRLFDGRYRFTPTTAARLAALAGALDWARAAPLRVSAVELAALAILADQPRDVAGAAMRRLAFTGEPLARLEAALASGSAIGTALAAAASPSARARLLRDRSDLELAWLRGLGDRRTRAAVDSYVSAARDVRPALSGDDLVRLGVPRGPAIARALGALRDARIDGQLGDREAETELVRRWIETREEARPWARNTSS